MKKKKIVATLCAAAMLFTMAACTGDSNTSTPSEVSGTTSSTAGESSTTEASTTSGSDKTVDVEFFSLKGEIVTVMDELIAKFNAENPGINVTQTSVADSGTVLLTRISTNDMPDLLNVFPAENKYKVMFDDGMMTELTDQPFMANVEDIMLEMAAYNGKHYALPMTLSSYGIYYRTDIFEEHGITEPTTYEELLAACKTLKDAGIDAFALPNKDAGNCAQRLERLMGVLNNDSNEEFQKIKNGELKVEDSATIRGFGQLCVDIAEYSTDDDLGLDYESAVADLANGKAGMMISGTWMLSTLQASNPDIQVKLIPFPSPISTETKVPVNIDTSFALAADSPYQEEGLKFIEFMAQAENAQTYYGVDGNVSMIKGVVYDKDQHMTMKTFMDNGDMFLTQVNFWPTGLREEVRPASQQLFVDQDVDAFVASFGDAIDSLYEEK